MSQKDVPFAIELRNVLVISFGIVKGFNYSLVRYTSIWLLLGHYALTITQQSPLYLIIRVTLPIIQLILFLCWLNGLYGNAGADLSDLVQKLAKMRVKYF